MVRSAEHVINTWLFDFTILLKKKNRFGKSWVKEVMFWARAKQETLSRGEIFTWWVSAKVIFQSAVFVLPPPRSCDLWPLTCKHTQSSSVWLFGHHLLVKTWISDALGCRVSDALSNSWLAAPLTSERLRPEFTFFLSPALFLITAQTAAVKHYQACVVF